MFARRGDGMRREIAHQEEIEQDDEPRASTCHPLRESRSPRHKKRERIPTSSPSCQWLVRRIPLDRARGSHYHGTDENLDGGV